MSKCRSRSYPPSGAKRTKSLKNNSFSKDLQASVFRMLSKGAPKESPKVIGKSIQFDFKVCPSNVHAKVSGTSKTLENQWF